MAATVKGSVRGISAPATHAATVKDVSDTFGNVEEYYLGAPVPEGKYRLRVVAAEKVVAESTGNPYVRQP